MRRVHIGLLVMAAALVANTYGAQPGEISDDDVARVVRTLPKITDEMVEAVKPLARQPSDADIQRAAVPAAPRIEALPTPMSKKTLDAGAVARGYAAIQQPNPVTANGGRLLIFVSLSMPSETLARLTDQASRAGATMLIRGLKNGSMRETVTSVHELIGTRRVAFGIDPVAFERFGVTQVPTFVVVKAGTMPKSCGAEQCIPPDAFGAAWGDVSLDYALEYIGSNAADLRGEVGHFLKRLRG